MEPRGAREREDGYRRRGLEVWAVEQIEAPPPVLPADGADRDHGSGSEASTASQGTAEGFSGFDSRPSSCSSLDGASSRRSSFSGESETSYDTGSRRSSVSSDGGYASDASSGGYASDASSGGYTSDASGYTSDGYASSDGERGASHPVVCRAHPLHHAAATSDAEAVAQLLQAGEDPNGVDKHGCTPLHRAAHSGDLDVVRQILCARADVAAVTEHGHTALHRACMRGHAEVTAELLRAGADHTVATSRGYTALHYAARAGYASSARFLLEARADPDIRDFLADSRNTPMHKACQHGRGEAVYTLLGYNGRPELLNAMRRTPRQVAEDHGEEEAVAVIEAFAHSALLLARSQLLAFAGLLHHRLGTKSQLHRVANADLAQMVGLAYAEMQRVCTSHGPEEDLLPPPLPMVVERAGGLGAVADAVELGTPPGVPVPEIWAQPEPEAGLGVADDVWLVAARPRVVHAHLEAVRAEIRLVKQQRHQARRERRAVQAAIKASGTGRQKQQKSSFGRGSHDRVPIEKLNISDEHLPGDGSGDDRDAAGLLHDSTVATEGHATAASCSASSRAQSSSPRGHSRRRRVRFRLDVRWKLERNDIVEM